MKSMQISMQEKKENAQESVTMDSPKYPYGLKLHFDEKSFEKLELKETPTVGQKFMILGYAEVCDVQQYKTEGDIPKISMGLQIMDIEVKSEEKKKNVADELYKTES